jgi:hypothetical protein
MANEGIPVQEKAAPVATGSAAAVVPGEQVVSGNKVDEKTYHDTLASIKDYNKLELRLHAKTWLMILAVCLVYFAQVINVVGVSIVSY